MTREQQLIESYLKSHKATKCRAICKPKPISKSCTSKSTHTTSSVCVVHKSITPVSITKASHCLIDATAVQNKLLEELDEFNNNRKQRRADIVSAMLNILGD